MQHASQADAIEVELICSLFETLTAAIIMTVGFLVAGLIIARGTGDAVLGILLAAGALTSAVRLGIAYNASRFIGRRNLSIGQARLIQKRFGWSYFGFAVVLGLFAARVMTLPWPESHMVVISLLVGYAAGVSASVGLRPQIAIPSMLVAILPTAVIAVSRLDELYVVTGLLMAAFLCGGIQSLRKRYRRAVVNTGRRITYANLARQDHLTALANRLALREWFDENVIRDDNAGLVAVHCLDLNGFKPVNDTYGHPVGDVLLAAVAGRLNGAIRGNDIAARLGGDEFAVVQCGLSSPEEAAVLAQRLADAIAEPFRIQEHVVRISTSIGYVLSANRSEDVEYLLSLADEALYVSKHKGVGITRYAPLRSVAQREAA